MQASPPFGTEPSDEILVDQVKRRDVAAFTQLYDRYAQPVYALAAHLLSPHDAEEIVQEVFLRLWNRAEQFDASRGRFKGWFMTVARHTIFDQLKQRQSEQRIQALYEIERLLSEPVDPAQQASDAAWLQASGAALRLALSELPPEQRRAIIMAYFGEMTQSAIAAELGWPLGTVKKRIRLGMQKLRKHLGQWRELAQS